MRSMKITKTDTVSSFLTKITQVRDELAAVGETIQGSELVRTALSGFPKKWEVFVEGIVARENIPSCKRLWDNCIQEEIRRGSKNACQHAEDDEENVSLPVKRNKKSKKGFKGGTKSKGEGKKDMSKVKCFACHKMGHYASQFPNKKKKQVAASAEMEEFSTKFKKEFYLLVCLSSSASSTSVWYVDSIASRHMTGVHEHFTYFTEIGVNLEVVLNDNFVVKVVGIGTISFQRESQPPMLVRDVLYVLGFTNNPILSYTIEDSGYEVVLRDGQVLVYPKGSSITSAKVIGIQHENIYMLMFQLARELIYNTNNSDLCELWHMRMAHLIHGSLRVLREIVTEVPNFNTKHQDVCKGCALGKYTNNCFSKQ
jgi:hypothetical protein